MGLKIMAKLKNLVTLTPLELDWLRQEIALERVGYEQLGQRLGELVSAFGRKTKMFLFQRDAIPALKISSWEIDRVLKKVHYIDLALIEVYVPVGLTVSYREAIDVLSSVQAQVSTIETRLLTPFNRWLGELMNRPSALAELSGQKQFQFLDCEALNHTLNQLFDSQSLSDKATYQAVIARQADWPVVIDQLKALIAQHNALKSLTLSDGVKAISERVDRLLPILKQPEHLAILSEGNKMAFANAVYDIAQEVTLYTRLNFIITSLRKAVHDSFQKLKEIGRGK